MTSLSLLFWIVLGVLVQLTVYLGMVFWRHWEAYKTLLMQNQVANFNLGQDKSSWTEGVGLDARLGFQTFRVDNKVVENTNQSICSFYLVPEKRTAASAFFARSIFNFQFRFANYNWWH